jgi:chromosome segregation ATPase
MARTTEQGTIKKLFKQRNEAQAEVERLTEALRQARATVEAEFVEKTRNAVQATADMGHAALVKLTTEYAAKFAESGEYHKEVNRKLLAERDLTQKHLDDAQARVVELEANLAALDEPDVLKLRKRLARQSEELKKASDDLIEARSVAQRYQRTNAYLRSRLPPGVVSDAP